MDLELTNPGHYIATEVLRIAKYLQSRSSNAQYSLTVRWTAGHQGIADNEKANREAKHAADSHNSNSKDLPKYIRKKLKHSVSALQQANNKERNEKWKEEWQASKHYRCFKAKDIISPASQKFLTLTSDHRISRNMASLIFQLRTGHAPLNEYLHHFKKIDSANCLVCSDQHKTAEHFLLNCPKHTHKHWPLQVRCNRTILSFTDLLSNSKLILPLINYI